MLLAVVHQDVGGQERARPMLPREGPHERDGALGGRHLELLGWLSIRVALDKGLRLLGRDA